MFWLTYFWIPHSVGMTQISAAPTFIMDNICRSALNTLSFDMIIKINQLLFPKLYFIVISYPWDLQTFWHRHLCMIKNVSFFSRLTNTYWLKMVLTIWIPNSVGMPQISAASPFIMDNICRSVLNIISFDMIIKI